MDRLFELLARARTARTIDEKNQLLDEALDATATHPAHTDWARNDVLAVLDQMEKEGSREPMTVQSAWTRWVTLLTYGQFHAALTKAFENGLVEAAPPFKDIDVVTTPIALSAEGRALISASRTTEKSSFWNLDRLLERGVEPG